MPGNKYASIKYPRMYRSLRRAGYSKESAARISNAHVNKYGLKSLFDIKAFDESKVDRDEGGQFSSGSGGGGAKPKKTRKPRAPKKTDEQRAAEAAAKKAEAEKNSYSTMAALQINENSAEALRMLAADDGDMPSAQAVNQAGFVEAGLVKVEADGSFSITPAGRALIKASETGDTAAAGRVIERSRAKQERKRSIQAARQQQRASRQQRGGRPAPQAAPGDLQQDKAMKPGRRRVYRQAYAAGKANGLPPAEARRHARYALRTHGAQAAQRRADLARMAIYKDARGQDRWVAISSTAYRDADDEIVSSRAIKRAVAIGDSTGQRGPLRYWHVPQLDIGDCDYQAALHDGRFLLESGTFRKPEYAAAVKAGPPQQVSIGFLHPATQPLAGVYEDIVIFERSILPEGRAANHMTRLTTKERRMDATKRAAAITLFGEQLLNELLSQTEQTDKESQQAGIAYKDSTPPAETVKDSEPPAWAAAILTRLDALEQAQTVKEPMPLVDVTTMAEDPMADEVTEAVAEDMVEAAADDDDLVDMTVGQLRMLVQSAVADAIAQQLGAMTGTLAEMDQRLGSMGYSRGEGRKESQALQAAPDTPDGNDAATRQLEALRARVADLEGLQPRSASLGMQISPQQASAIKQASGDPNADPISSFLAGFQLNGAH